MTPPEALRLLRVSRRDLQMAHRLIDPDVAEASWGWLHALNQDVPRTHDIARLLLLLQSAGVDVSELLPLRAFTAYAVQFRYDDEPEELGLDRASWCERAKAWIDRVERQIS